MTAHLGTRSFLWTDTGILVCDYKVSCHVVICLHKQNSRRYYYDSYIIEYHNSELQFKSQL